MTAERRSKQFMHEAAEALDLHAVVEEKEEHAQRHAERAVEVSSRQRTEMIEADQTSNRGEQVNRNQVDGVHQRDPAECAVEMLVEMVNNQAKNIVHGDRTFVAPLALTVFCWVALAPARRRKNMTASINTEKKMVS